MTDGDRKTCATYRASSGTTSSLTVTLSSDSNIYYNVHEVELDLQIYTTAAISSNLNEGVELQVFVQTTSSSVLCKRLGVYDSGAYRFTCATEEVGWSKMKINLLHRDKRFQTKVCEIQVYGSRYTGECERPPIVVGARANFTSTYWNSTAVYSCVPPYRYAGGNPVITCHFGGYWTTPSIFCKEMENLARQAASLLPAVIDDDRSTCDDVDEIELNLMTRSEVQWIVVSTSLENSDMSVTLTISGSKTSKTCLRIYPSASMEGYDMTAFICQGYPFADTVNVTGGSSNPVCEIEVYGRSASQGALQCKQQDNGRDYKGDLNFTVTGKPCIVWPDIGYSIENFPDYSFQEIGSKCRAPSTTAYYPFCYISPSQIEYCPIQLCDSVCRQGDGRTYSGRIGKANGTSCGHWNSLALNELVFTGIDSGAASSYCRNPLGSMSRPWCYKETGAPSLCSIPICPTSVAVETSLPVSSPRAKATCFCWYNNYPDSYRTYPDRAVSDAFDQCSRWGFAIMMCYTEDVSWTFYSIGTYVSSSSVYETSSTQEVPLISSTPPEVRFTSSTFEVTLTSRLTNKPLTSSNPAVSLTSCNPAVTLSSSTPEITFISSTPAVSLTSSSLEVTLTSSTTDFQTYRNVTPVGTSLVQSSSVSTNYSSSKAAYNLSASSSSFSSSDQSSFVPSVSSSSYNLSSSPSITDVELNISSTFEPSTQSFHSLSSVVAMSSSTPSTTVGTTEVPTTTSTPTTTPALKQNCQCRCKRNLSPAALSEVMDERKANLTVNPRETAAFLRKKTSAKDKRPTATVSGTTCLAIVSVMFSCIFIPDIINVVSFFTKCIKK
ncbi:uncharacterized protein LOC124274945 [Haliotis rubra]|uniref:uncharacterized protein LOC124274945 n=1 Tax=Haliotis rubra TaxID=36100 RepID=UPI001EE544E0|nr:uncharacterized protein LOC124274945 [Haliotis rubra]